MLCKTKPTGRIFPLPTSSLYLGQVFVDDPHDLVLTLRTVGVSLNSLNGEGSFNENYPPTEFQKEILRSLMARTTVQIH